MKRPASQYYWGDWRRDTALQSCSLTARGLWHEMNCLMHDCEPYGHLCVGASAMQPAQLARLVGVTQKECSALLDELEAAGVFSRDSEGVIFSRRMVRDEDLRERRANGGQLGAEHGAKGAAYGSKGGRPRANKGGSETPLSVPPKPPPAIASASASAKELSPTTCPPLRPKAAEDRTMTAQDLEDEGVEAGVARDWLKVRKAKKAPLTATAWEGVKREAVLAGITTAEAVRHATEGGWQGFKAAWLKRDGAKPGHEPMSFSERATEAKAQRIAELTGGMANTPLRTAKKEIVDVDATEIHARRLA